MRTGRLGHQRAAELDELVDVELVVGEQHEVLEMLGRSAGVVAQAVQRVVDPRCGEQRQRVTDHAPGIRARVAGAVGDAVVHRTEVREVEQVAHQAPSLRAQVAFDVFILGNREMQRQGLAADTDLERDLVILDEQAELFEIVVGKKVGARQRGFVGTRARDKAVAQPRVGPRDGRGADAHHRIEGPASFAEVLTGDESPQCITQRRDAGIVDRTDLFEGRGRVIETDRFDWGGIWIQGTLLFTGSGIVGIPPDIASLIWGCSESAGGIARHPAPNPRDLPQRPIRTACRDIRRPRAHRSRAPAPRGQAPSRG